MVKIVRDVVKIVAELIELIHDFSTAGFGGEYNVKKKERGSNIIFPIILTVD